MLEPKVWRIARYQFEEQVRQRSFLIILFSLPLFVGLSVVLGVVNERAQVRHTVLGYVDQAALLVDTSLTTVNDEVRLIALATPDEARAALKAGQIDAYYVLPANYRDSGRAELVYLEPPPYAARGHFENVVRLNLMAGLPRQVAMRTLGGSRVTVRAIDSGREFPAGGPSAGQTVPLIVGLIFTFLILTGSGTMMEVLVNEKENRTIEVVISSVSARQMMAGKIAGAIGITLLQLAVWLAFIVAAVWLGRGPLEVRWLQSISIDWRDVGLLVVAALPAFVCLAALMSAVGAVASESEDAQQLGPLLFLLLLLPLYLLVPVAEDPQGALATGLSVVPFTAVMTLAVRSLLVQVPAWQFIASAAVSAAAAIGAVWLAAAAFRAGMLRYGRRLRWRELFSGQAARRGTA